MAVESESAEEIGASEPQNGSDRSRLRRLGNKRIRRRLLSQLGRIFERMFSRR